MAKAVAHAAATARSVIPLTRYDMNISNGIIYTLKEQNVTDLLIGMHKQANQKDFLGNTADEILKHTSETVFIYKPLQPFNTLKRIIVAVTLHAELEPGFAHWFAKLVNIAKEAGLSIGFYATKETLKELVEHQRMQKTEVKMFFNEFNNWEDF